MVNFIVSMAKKRWINSKSTELLVDNSEEVDILWSSSSESEISLNLIASKRIKVSDKKLIKARKATPKQYKKHKRKKLRNDRSSEEINKPSPSNQHEFSESPVLGPLKTEELSPVLSQDERYISHSPIIGNGIKLRRRKPKLSDRDSFPCKNDIENQDFMLSQSSSVIIESDSPSKPESPLVKVNEINLSESTSTVSEEKAITPLLKSEESLDTTPFSKSDSPRYLISSASSNEVSNRNAESPNSSSKSNLEALYFEISPRKKRKPKKQGWAEKLHKALEKQTSDYAIWEHELYLKKSKGSAICNVLEPSIIVKVESFWKEYEATVVKGLVTKSDENVSSSVHNNSFRNSDDGKCLENNNKCLIILGYNANKNVKVYLNGTLQIYLPFNRKIIIHNEEAVFCFFNVFKFLTFEGKEETKY